jgi:hypothetical protein
MRQPPVAMTTQSSLEVPPNGWACTMCAGLTTRMETAGHPLGILHSYSMHNTDSYTQTMTSPSQERWHADQEHGQREHTEH